MFSVSLPSAYASYDFNTFKSIVNNGFAPEKLVFGMLGDNYENATAFGTAMTQLHTIATVYPQIAGAILWEYGDTKIDGVVWGQAVRRALGSHSSACSPPEKSMWNRLFGGIFE